MDPESRIGGRGALLYLVTTVSSSIIESVVVSSASSNIFCDQFSRTLTEL